MNRRSRFYPGKSAWVRVKNGLLEDKERTSELNESIRELKATQTQLTQ